MHTKTVIEHGTHVVFVEGRLGHHSAGELEQVLSRDHPNGASPLVIDLSGVDYLSSAALKILRSAAQRQSQDGGSLRLRAPSDAARFALELSGLLELID